MPFAIGRVSIDPGGDNGRRMYATSWGGWLRRTAPAVKENDLALAPEGSATAGLWTRYHGLAPTKKLVMHVKALIGSATNKTAFVAAMVAARSRAADGRAWTVKSVNEVLDELQKDGLLDASFACPVGLLHSLAVDAAGGARHHDYAR